MKVCLISREFAPFFGAGIGTYAACWARALTEAGHDVHVLTRNHEGVLEQGPSLYPGITFHVINPADGPPKLDHNYPYARHALAVLKSVRRLHERFGFDVIEYPDYWAEGHALSQAKRTTSEFDNVTLVCRLHTSSALCRQLDDDSTYPHYAAYLDIMEHESIAHADVVLSPSTDLLRTTREYLARHDLGEINEGHVLRYPFDVASTADLRTPGAQTPAQASEPTVLYFGRMEQRKGVDLLVRAAQVLLDKGIKARFVFVGGDTGSGPFGRSMRKHMQKLVRPEWQNRFELLPPVPRAQLGPMIDSATLCCFPARWDNFPNALLEAMASGAAVVSTNTGGPGEIIELETSGLLCQPTPDALATTLERALADDQLRAHIAGHAPERIATLCKPREIVSQFSAHIAGVRVPRETPTETPLVSVIIPHYNLAEFLPETLESIERQTYANIETIVIDDGSTDPDSIKLIESLDRANLRVVRQANQGLSGARNTGIREARGEFILPVDADDLISPTFVEKAVRVMQREPKLAYVTALVGYFRQSPARRFGGWVPLGLHRNLLPIHNCAGCCMALFRADALHDAGGYSTDLTSYEDWDLYCALAERGLHGAVIPDIMLHYRIRPDSLLRTEVEMRRQHLHARVLEKHPDLPRNHSRVLRTMLSEQMEAAKLERAGLRYKLADRINEAIKGSPVHGLVKGLAQRTIEIKQRRRSEV
ncbi:MAG: glycosyltransferase [Phycisphaerales bacterium]|nr:glycosyltransferase [Phycisphaerales bacterium]MCB9837668.1 glycosyltransferase [Phycisphaera sp.]